MDRLLRRSRKDSPSRPDPFTDGSNNNSGKTTPEPGAQQPQETPHVRTKKSSPFRGLLRSHKRARSPPPASLPQSATAAVPDRPASSPISVRKQSLLSADEGQQQEEEEDEQDDAGSKADGGNAGRPPKIPSFLTLSSQEIEAKFQEIQWKERTRTMSGNNNPSPEFPWAPLPTDHPRKLDRYVNIQPWHNNRVKLKVPSGRTDYINASPIVLAPTPGSELEPDRYIAMQGPKLKTTDHVWRMVVEQLESPAVIVMLTDTHEGDIEKCYPYFPRSPEDKAIEVGRKDEFGDGFRASVRCEAIEETAAGDAIELRKLVIRVRKGHKINADQPTNGNAINATSPPAPKMDDNGDIKMLSPQKDIAEEEFPTQEDSGIADVNQEEQLHDLDCEFEERIVWHFLYKQWPDFGVPTAEDLESFFTLMHLSREKNASASNPRIVHCSAGVGRSGTFIALEHLIRELETGVVEHWDYAQHGRRRGSASSTTVNFTGKTENGNNEARPAPTGLATPMKPGETGLITPSDSGLEIIEGEDLIFNTVNQLREQRRHMVQAEPQFLFIYQVMRKLWQDKYGAVVDEGGEPAAKRLATDPFVED